jgi:hypothetical protein
MRKVIFGGANSLDNYFARKDHSTDWLRWSNEAAAVTAMTRQIDLKLLECRPFKNGCVLVKYRVNH